VETPVPPALGKENARQKLSPSLAGYFARFQAWIRAFSFLGDNSRNVGVERIRDRTIKATGTSHALAG
jgi:hypothetical protein